jgi:hypothetical protein
MRVVASTRWCVALVTLAFVVAPALPLSGQSWTVHVSEDALHVRPPASGFVFIKGEPLEHLKDGRSVRFDFALSVLARPAAAATTEGRRSFVLSYDLWEERFAVGDGAHSISHLTSADAEQWCLDHLTVPVSALGRLGHDRPFWVRLQYRVQSADEDTDAGRFTLRGLIDSLSRRRSTSELKESIEAGPFTLN